MTNRAANMDKLYLLFNILVASAFLGKRTVMSIYHLLFQPLQALAINALKMYKQIIPMTLSIVFFNVKNI